MLDEAMEMLVYFDSLVAADASFPEHWKFLEYLEQESDSTRSNIQRLMQGDFLDGKKETNLFVVSSLFHLPSLAHELEDYVHTHRSVVGTVVLVSAEELHGEQKVAQLPIYLKSMFYEVYSHLFSAPGTTGSQPSGNARETGV